MINSDNEKLTPTNRAATSEKLEKCRRQKDVFQLIKDKELAKYEDHDSEASILESIQFSSLMADSNIGKTLMKTKEEDLPELFSELLRHLIKRRKEKNLLVESTGSTNLREEIEKAAASGTVSVYPGEIECCDDTESSAEDSDDELTELHKTPWEEEDKILPSSSKKEGKDSFSSRYPNLPRVKCPRNLYISTLSPGHINSLYYTNNNAFPRQWDKLKRKDPLQAWASLNQTIIPYTNERWGSQGINIEDSETAVDYYNVNALKSALVETIEKALGGSSSTPKDPVNAHPSSEHQMRELTSKMEDMSVKLNEWKRLVTSDIVKRTQVEMNPRPIVLLPDPSISVSSYQNPITNIEQSREYTYQEEEVW